MAHDRSRSYTALATATGRHYPIAMNQSPSPRLLVIEPARGWTGLGLNELWIHRELFYFLTKRDVKVRYQQTLLGAVWAVLQPTLTMVVFSLFFGRLAKVPSDGLPYPIFAFAALVPWTFFANSMTQASNSLVTGANMVRKVYFPRLVVPSAAIMAGLVDALISFCVLLIMMPFFGTLPGVRILYLPLLVLLALVTSLGAGIWFSALNVQFRDVRYTVSFIVQIWMFATPIAYPSTLVPEPWRVVYALNPMVGVVEGFRWALLDAGTAPGSMVAVSAAVALLLLISGVAFFRRVERTFADVI